MRTGIEKQLYGQTADGKEVSLFTMTNANGLKAKVISYGAILASLQTPDRDGNFADIVLGFDTLEDWVAKNSPYMGAIIGRFANRIGGARFTLDGAEYKLATCDGTNHLHGGDKGFDKVVWDAEQTETDNGVAVKLTYLSPDSEEGYPGNLTVTVIYTLTNTDELSISYAADTDKPTIVNLTNHSYFNFKDAGASDTLGHELTINADKYTPLDEQMIPTGELRGIKGTGMDFNKQMLIGAMIENIEGSYDHNYVINDGGSRLTFAAIVYEQTTGRTMEVHTTQPGVQFYSGSFLNGSVVGKGRIAYNKHAGLCLETQHFPDSPNKSHFPSVVLRPGEEYSQLTVHKFSTR